MIIFYNLRVPRELKNPNIEIGTEPRIRVTVVLEKRR